MPAPFGPMMLVTAPGSARRETSSTATTPPKETESPSTASGSPVPDRARESGDVEIAGSRAALVDAAEPALDLAHHPAGGRHQDDEEQQPDEEQPVFREGGEELRQQDHDEGADDRPEDGSDPPDDGDEEEEDRLEEGKRFGADELGEGSEDRPRNPRDRGREGERGGPDHHRIEPERTGGELGVPDRPHRPAPRARVEAGEEDDGRDGEEGDQQRDVALDEGVSEGFGEGDEHDPVPAAGDLLPLRRALLDHEAERDGDHREVGAAHPEGGDREQHSREPRDHPRDRKGGPEAPPVRGGEDRPDVGADRVEAGVPERDLPGQPEQDVDRDPHHRGQPDEGDDVDLVAVRGDDGRHHEGGGSDGADPPEGLHTFLTSARPKRPCGRAARATMTSAKVTMWVYVEPRREVMRASARP